MTHTSPKLSPHIVEEASDWFIDISEGHIDPAGRERFDTWLRRSPEHVEAYLKIAALWEDTQLLEKSRVLASDELVARVLAEGNIVPLGISGGSSSNSNGADPSPVCSCPNSQHRPPLPAQVSDGLRLHATIEKRSRSRGPLVAIAASLSIGVAGIWLYVQRDTYSTAVGEQRSVRLEDGSTMDLNSQSKVRVRFNGRWRNVELLTGQALFRVAKDSTRPFVVATDNTHVRAIGTQFDVYRKGGGTIVTVLEGRVAVVPDQRGSPTTEVEVSPPVKSGETSITEKMRAQPKAAKPFVPEPFAAGTPSAGEYSHEDKLLVVTPRDGEILVAAGEQVTVAPDSVSLPGAADVGVATAWTQHKIAFRAAPLSDVVEEFNRYNTRQLVIVDEVLKDTKISGVFSSTDPDSLLRFLRQLPNIDVRESASGIRISPK